MFVGRFMYFGEFVRSIEASVSQPARDVFGELLGSFVRVDGYRAGAINKQDTSRIMCAILFVPSPLR